MPHKERPHVEIVHTARAVDEVHGSALAQRDGEQALLVLSSPLPVASEEAVQISFRDGKQSLQIIATNMRERTTFRPDLAHSVISVAAVLRVSGCPEHHINLSRRPETSSEGLIVLLRFARDDADQQDPIGELQVFRIHLGKVAPLREIGDQLERFHDELINRGKVLWVHKGKQARRTGGSQALNFPRCCQAAKNIGYIKIAQANCRDPNDAAEVWGYLLKMAEAKEGPLLSATDEGLQYLKQGKGADFLSKEALRKRIARGGR